MALTIDEQAKVAKISASFLFNLCKGTATVLKGTGYALEKSTSMTGTALHAVANGIETAGKVSSGVCYAGAKRLEDKAENDYNLSGLTDEQIKACLAEEDDIEEAQYAQA
jgi:hypothetical protein